MMSWAWERLATPRLVGRNVIVLGLYLRAVADRVAVAMLAVTLVGAPLLFGSRDDVTVAFWCGWLGIAAILASHEHMRRPHLLIVAGVGVLVAAFAFVLHEQLSSHPFFATFDPIWRDASAALQQPLQPSASISKSAPFFAIGGVLANLLALVVSLILGTDRHKANRMIVIVATVGAICAMYGMISDALAPTSILWREKLGYVGVVTGTFYNRNTAATYFGSAAIIWLAFLFKSIAIRLSPDRPISRQLIERIVGTARGPLFIIFFGFFICFAALLLTQSRAGVLFSFMCFVLLFWLSFFRRINTNRNRLIAVSLAILLMVAVLQFLAGAISTRLDMEGLTDAGRIATYRATLHMIADHFWFGTGLGTYAWAFPGYRSGDVSLWGIWDLAHSAPLQMAAEVGVPFTVTVGAAWIAALGLLLRGSLIRRRDKEIPIIAFVVGILALAHSSVDFSLQVPGYSIVVFALLGLGLGQAFRSPNDISDRDTTLGRRPRTTQAFKGRRHHWSRLITDH